MTTTVTLHEDAYPVVGHADAGVFEFGTDRGIDDSQAAILTAKGRLKYPGDDDITDEAGDPVRDDRYHRVYD